MKICRVENCAKPAYTRGVCSACYTRHRKNGTVDEVALPSNRSRKSVYEQAHAEELARIEKARAAMEKELGRPLEAYETVANGKVVLNLGRLYAC